MVSATDFLKDLCKQKSLTYVGTRGDVRSPVCMVGEAPGADEEASGLPFVGAAGQELERMMIEGGLSELDCWFTNPYKIRPPENKMPRLEELGIPKKIFEDQFLEELRLHKPSIICAAGVTPLGLLCPQTLDKKYKRAQIANYRGSLLRSPHFDWDHYVLPMYHPAFILREWGERPIGVLCLAKAQEELTFLKANSKLQPLPERELITLPNYDTVIWYLNECLNQKDPVSTDIEMLKRRWPYTIALARSPKSAISFELHGYEVDQLVKIWRLLNKIFLTKVQIGQNFLGFDATWLEFLNFSFQANLIRDLMVRHHILWPEFRHKLQFQTFQYTREPYYKDEGKNWHPREGIKPLMLYNAKDAAVSYEIFLEQEKEFDDRPWLRPFYSEYEQRLDAALHHIEKRGVLIHPKRLDLLRTHVLKELDKAKLSISGAINKPVAASKQEAEAMLAKDKSMTEVFNLGSAQQIAKVLKAAGLRVPTDKFSHRDTTAMDKLEELFLESNNPILKDIIQVRHLNKMLGTYVNAKLVNNVFYCNYIVTGTVTGRRSSRKTIFGYGSNMQNLPVYGELGRMFQECQIARPGKIFVHCDQSQAEDWIVNGIIADIGNDYSGLEELRAKVDRHRKLAAYLFRKPEAECHKKSMERFLGKKTRHAGNYDMQAPRMSQSLLKEGYNIPIPMCEWFLYEFHRFAPGIRGIFHKYVQNEMMSKRMLKNLLGRERYFFDLRPYSSNHKVFKEGYAYIPQSTVGDNTGMAILYVEDRHTDWLITDEHDGVTLEVDDNESDIMEAKKLLELAFDRTLTFPRGLTIKIPIEITLCYDKLNEVEVPCGSLDKAGLTSILDTLRSRQSLLPTIISGPVQPSLQPH